MSTFYLLPPRALLADYLARHLERLLPGLTCDGDLWSQLAEGLAAAAGRAGAFVVYHEELPADEDPARALADGYGAEPGDEVIEVHAGRGGDWAVRRWRVGESGVLLGQ